MHILCKRHSVNLQGNVGQIDLSRAFLKIRTDIRVISPYARCRTSHSISIILCELFHFRTSLSYLHPQALKTDDRALLILPIRYWLDKTSKTVNSLPVPLYTLGEPSEDQEIMIDVFCK